MPYTITHKPSDYICQCGAIVKVSYMQKHLLTAEHQRDVVGCENIIHTYVCILYVMCS
jgi:hypothetical protein